MNLRLRSLRWEEHDVCRASFDVEGSQDGVETVFHLRRTSIGVVATSDTDVFVGFDGTAGEARSIVSAVIHFCRVAQGELANGESKKDCVS